MNFLHSAVTMKALNYRAIKIYVPTKIKVESIKTRKVKTNNPPKTLDLTTFRQVVALIGVYSWYKGNKAYLEEV